MIDNGNELRLDKTMTKTDLKKVQSRMEKLAIRLKDRPDDTIDASELAELVLIYLREVYDWEFDLAQVVQDRDYWREVALANSSNFLHSKARTN